MLLALFLLACTPADDQPPMDTAAPDMLARRTTVAPPRRLETPTSGNSMDDEAPCNAGEEQWVRTACIDVHYPSTPGWDDNRGEWVCPRCYIDICAAPQYSEYYEEMIYPSLIQLPECPARRVPAERPRRVRQ
jgi:hypothetical protein